MVAPAAHELTQDASATPAPQTPLAPLKRGRGRPRKLPVAPIAEQIAHAVVAGKDLPGSQDHSYLERCTSRMERAVVAKILGPDVEAFRLLLADKMLAVASEMTDAIHRDINKMPPASRAFALCALADKSEQLRAKLSTSPRSAQVNVQINQFGPGTIDRSAILSALSGHVPTQPAAAQPVEQPQAISVEATPAATDLEPTKTDATSPMPSNGQV